MATTEELVSLFRSMWRIRLIEETLAKRYAEQEMRCPMHLCIGQEAIASGVCAALNPDDVVFSNHRAHGHYLAKGGDLKAMVAELYGRSTGCCGGRGGSMHLIDQRAGFLGATPIVGGTVPVAVGAAWAARLKGEKKVGVAFFGDGCFEEGVIHESMNFAVLYKLPVLFVCENNNFSVYTPLRERQPARPIHVVAQAHGCGAWHSDGNDVEAVYALAREAVHRARAGEGPSLIEVKLTRYYGHFEGDAQTYRDMDELKEMREVRDCLKQFRDHTVAAGLLDISQLDDIDGEVERQIEDSVIKAKSDPKPPAAWDRSWP